MVRRLCAISSASFAQFLEFSPASLFHISVEPPAVVRRVVTDTMLDILLPDACSGCRGASAFLRSGL
jgi:hypothetical protein